MAIRGATTTLAAVACVAAMAALAPFSCSSARAQAPADEKTVKETELRGLEDTLKASEDERRKIEADVEAIKLDRVRLNAALIETTAKVQDTEAKRAEASQRLDALAAEAVALSRSLEGRRDALADALGALERMGENPPPAILVKPNDMAEAVRAAIVLGSMVPEMQEEAQAAARDLGHLEELKSQIAKERDDLAASAKSLVLDKTKLTDLIAARQQSLDLAESALEAERKRGADLANQALTLKDLIARMESLNPSLRPGGDLAPPGAVGAGKLDPARLQPAIAFADAKSTLLLPVAGAVVKNFGAPDGFGGAEKGVSIATPPKATVSTPIDGWVVYAGPYRSYGQLLILNAGQGYYMVLAGMERINVLVGQFVLAGEAVAAMGDGSSRTTAAAAIGAAQPVLYIELRKNETAIDPGPWWAKDVIEKAHG